MDVESLSGITLYVILFVVIFVESGILVGFWLPGNTVLFGAGLVAADPAADASITVLALGVPLAAVLGAILGYATGHRLGRPYLERRYPSVLGRTEVFYQRYGAVTLIATRFVPWVRTFAPVLAGAVAMPRYRFGAAIVTGALIWGAGLVLLGYAASSVPGLRDTALLVGSCVVVVSVLAGAVGERMRRRALRPRDTERSAGSTAT